MAIDPVTAGLEFGGKLIDRLWPNKADAEMARLKLAEMSLNGELARLTADTELAKGQLAINAAEAQHASLFVAGWRPAVGWVCVLGLTWQFVVGPVAVFTADLLDKTCAMPEFDTFALITLLGALLGIGTLRTVERINGVIPPGR